MDTIHSKVKMKNTPIVSITIGIITFRRCESLKRCLASIDSSVDIVKKHSIRISVIVVEDSIDGNFCEINRSSLHFELAHIKNEMKIGVAESRNKILDKADGDFLLFIDDDNEIDKMMIAELVNFTRSHEFGVVGPQAFSQNFVRKTYSGIKRTRFFGRNLEVYSNAPFFEVDDVQNCFLFNLKEARNNSIRFDPKFIHEIGLFCLKFKKLGKKNFIVNSAKTIHHNKDGHFTLASFGFAWFARSRVWKEEGNIFPLILSPLSVLVYDIFYILRYTEHISIHSGVMAIVRSYLNTLKGLLE